MNNMILNELYKKIIDLDLSEYTHEKLYDLCFKLDDEIERLNKALLDIKEYIDEKSVDYIGEYVDVEEIIDIVNKALGDSNEN